MGGYYRIIRSLEKRPKRKGKERYEEKFMELIVKSQRIIQITHSNLEKMLEIKKLISELLYVVLA